MLPRVRTFIAVELGLDIRVQAARLIARFKNTGADVKWVEIDNLHWTLKFLGDVERNDIPAVCTAAQRAVAEMPPFDLETQGVGAFPNIAHPRTVWVGVGSGREELIDLNERLEQALEPLGFRREARRFQPHLTLGRVRGSRGEAELAEMLSSLATHRCGAMSVDEIVVFSSTLERRGPSYEPLATAELRG